MPHPVINIHPDTRAVRLLLPAGILGHPQRLHRTRRVDHPLRPVNLRRQIPRRQEPRPRLGISECLSHQGESLRERVAHVFCCTS